MQRLWGKWTFWTKVGKYGAAREEEKRRTTEMIYGCSEGGYAEKDNRGRVGWKQMIHCGNP